MGDGPKEYKLGCHDPKFHPPYAGGLFPYVPLPDRFMIDEPELDEDMSEDE